MCYIVTHDWTKRQIVKIVCLSTQCGISRVAIRSTLTHWRSVVVLDPWPDILERPPPLGFPAEKHLELLLLHRAGMPDVGNLLDALEPLAGAFPGVAEDDQGLAAVVARTPQPVGEVGADRFGQPVLGSVQIDSAALSEVVADDRGLGSFPHSTTPARERNQ